MTSTKKIKELPFGLVVGLKKGFVVTKRKRQDVSRKQHKRHHHPQRSLAKEVVREVVGFSPYERRLMELLRNGLDKRALKLAKKRLGTHGRAKKKREMLSQVIASQRLAAQKKAEAAATH